MSEERVRRGAATIAIIVVITVAALLLRFQGRLWTCACGEVYFWAGNVWSAHNSQHFLDPYAFTHLLHGFLFFWVMALAARRLWPSWQFVLAVFAEAIWEVIENTEFAIERYRTATISIGYEGDTILNSAGDLLVCGLGFWLARYLGLRLSIVVFCLTELALLVWIRDSLVLNIVMLFFPIDAIKAWQLGG